MISCGVQDVALTMLFTGHDTTAVSLALMMRYLKVDPGHLQRVCDEQQQVTLQTNPFRVDGSRPARHVMMCVELVFASVGTGLGFAP